jgi:hypothetical protein
MPYAICDKYSGKPVGEMHDTETDAWIDAINRKLTTQSRTRDGLTIETIHPGYEVREVIAPAA